MLPHSLKDNSIGFALVNRDIRRLQDMLRKKLETLLDKGSGER
jgi:hypothetical protein